mgnify:CR=1 FL=1
MKHVLAVDIGASGGRDILGSIKDGKLHTREVHRFENEPVTKSGRLVWQPERLIDEIIAGIKKCSALGVKPDCVGVDTWGVDYVLLDGGDNMVGDAVHYRDKRTDGVMERVTEQIGRGRIYGSTGIQFMQFNTIFQLAAQAQQTPEELKEAKSLLFMPDFLAFRLTGCKAAEYTIASTSQLLDAGKRSWDRELITSIGVNPSLFQDIVFPGRLVVPVRKSLAEECGAEGLQFAYIGSHDTASAVAAVPAKDPGFLYISSGTWALIGVEEQEPCLGQKAMGMNLTNEGGVFGKIRLLRNITGMWLIQQVRKDAGKKMGYGEYQTLALAEQPFRSIVNPDDACFFHPDNMTEAIRDYCRRTGQPVPETPGQIARCIYDSMALAYRNNLEMLEDTCSRRFDTIHIVGGGCQNEMLNQLTADVCRRKVVAGPIEATAVGNIMMQLVALGQIRDLREGRKLVAESFDLKEYIPKIGSNVYDKAYMKFLNFM